jgi:Carboxypeptidase regulatory-like domain
MFNKCIHQLALTIVLATSLAGAQQNCANGARVEGTITDPTGAVIPGAEVKATDAQKTLSDATGHYVLPCVPTGAATITAHASGFTAGTARVGAGPEEQPTLICNWQWNRSKQTCRRPRTRLHQMLIVVLAQRC